MHEMRESTSRPRATRPREPELGLGELIGRTGHDVADLLRCEVELARLELSEEARAAVRASAVLAAGGVLGFLALLLLLFAAAWGLAEVMAPGFAFLVVGAAVAVLASILIWAGRRRAARLDPAPHQTATTLKEDVRWARQQLT